MLRSKGKSCLADQINPLTTGPARLYLVVFLFLASTGFAQTATITGTVTDTYNVPIAKAAIQATNLMTKGTFRVVSSATGTFTLSQLPAGTYALFASAAGMRAFEQQNIVLGSGQASTIHIHLGDGISLNTLGERDDIVAKRSSHPTPTGPTPRTADGKPDLSGMWHAQNTVDSGKPEPLPWVQELQRERAENSYKDYPLSRCLPGGATLFGAIDFYRVVQTPTHLVMIDENDVPGHRQIFLDGRIHPKNLEPTWMGHSIGKWEGDTLIVDTVGFNDKTWLSLEMSPHTEKMRLTERFRRPDLGHLEVELTIDDPEAYAKPWTIKRVSDLAPDEDVQEFCTENNRDLAHMVGK